MKMAWRELFNKSISVSERLVTQDIFFKIFSFTFLIGTASPEKLIFNYTPLREEAMIVKDSDPKARKRSYKLCLKT